MSILIRTRRFIYYLMVMLFIIPACGGTKSVYEQKRSLMILSDVEQPRNKKALAGNRKRQKKNKKKAKNRNSRSKSHKRR